LLCYKEEEEEEEGDDSKAAIAFLCCRPLLRYAIAFFATLHCSAAPQEHSKEEQTKQTNEKKNKDAYMGPAWVSLRL